ncbi:MAG: sodium-dependent transporter [Methylococcaceae bacterium]|nr:sodium-dependent transporter [Methylococcaceae bacterium]
MIDKQSLHGEWSSRFAFILAATGSAVGLGNIWKFPYIAGENGGSAFVMVYVLCVLLMGIPIMMAETMLGRRAKRNPVDTMRTLTQEAGADSRWQYLAWMGMVAGFLILSYYSVIAGWASAYTLKAVMGDFFGSNAEKTELMFNDFISSPLRLIFWHSFFMLATMVIVSKGIKNGLERAVQMLMPVLFVMMFLLVGYAMTTSGYQQGLHFLFSPDFSKITGKVVLTAIGQAFFSLGLGMGTMMIYGAYLPKNVSIGKSAIIVAGADTIVALLAGIAIFPIVFANGLQPDSGPGLVFETLPIAFGNMTGGWLFGVLFFIMLVVAALTSSIALIEPAVAWLIESKEMTRDQACVRAGLVAWALGFVTVFSFNRWADIRFFGHTLFELIDGLTANIMLPLGGLAIAVFAGWVMKQQHTEQELALPTQQYALWKVLISYVAPAGVFLIFLHVVGVL